MSEWEWEGQGERLWAYMRSKYKYIIFAVLENTGHTIKVSFVQLHSQLWVS